MKKRIVFTTLISFTILGFFNTVYADTIIRLDIKTPTRVIYNQDITVIPCNSDNNSTLIEIATPYCAIRQSGIQNDWNWAWAPGAFLNSLDNIAGYTTKDKNNNDVYHYWSWSLNSTEGTTGLNQYELQPNDLISLNFIDPTDPIDPTPAPPTGSGALLEYAPVITSATIPDTTPAPLTKPTFNIEKAFQYLISQQKSDGSFGEDLYTDWVALALASGNYQDQVIKLVKYFGESKIAGTLLTDYERHAMALMALGLNPYNTDGENYIEKIIAGFDGKQFGNASEDNDDIFALIVLQNAGYTPDEKMISDDINFILSRQKENGSWDESVDMTGASIEALSAFSPIPGIGESLEKAKEFLKQNQKDNGSWGNNVSSTAWALEGILALNEKPEDWKPARNASGIADAGGKSENTLFDYFATIQDTDGGIKNEYLQNRIWETAYVASALSGKIWNQIMQKFEKPKTPVIMETAPILARNATQSVAGRKNIPTARITRIKNIKPKLENSASQNTAATIAAIAPSSTIIKTETPKKNWFVRLLENIFGSF